MVVVFEVGLEVSEERAVREADWGMSLKGLVAVELELEADWGTTAAGWGMMPPFWRVVCTSGMSAEERRRDKVGEGTATR